MCFQIEGAKLKVVLFYTLCDPLPSIKSIGMSSRSSSTDKLHHSIKGVCGHHSFAQLAVPRDRNGNAFHVECF